MIYNWPQATGVDIPAEAVAELSDHPNIIAIKESSGNLEKVMQMIREVKPGFQVLVGSAPTLWPSFAVGAVGRGTGLRQRRSLFHHRDLGSAPHPRRGGGPGLAEPHRPRGLAGDSEVRIPGLKHAMDLNGYYGGPCRSPLAPPTPEAKKEIEEAFRDLKG